MIYLCKPHGILLGSLNNVTDNSVSLTKRTNDTWELSFDLPRYINIDGKLIESDYYLSVNEMMELLLVEEEKGFRTRFQIDSEPTIKNDGQKEVKTVTAHSIEWELSKKFLRAFKVNCGTKDSQEYLLGYYNDNDEFFNLNLNPYTNLPIDYIVVHNNYAEELQEILDWLKTVNIEVSPINGKVRTTNETILNKLREIYTNYPRLACDCYYDDNNEYKCHVYMKVNDDGSIYITANNGSYSQSSLESGIESLIDFYNQYGHQLSLIDLALENAEVAGWSVGDIPADIARKKYNFEVDGQDILSFFRQVCTSTMKVIFEFDRYNRKVEIIDIANEDKHFDTGVFVSMRNLMDEFDIHSSSTDGIKTKFRPLGQNKLGILYANFGEDFIVNLDWFVDKVDEYGELQYVSRDFHDRYHDWIKYRENTAVTYSLPSGSTTYDNRRIAYRELTKLYNQYMIDIDNLKNLLPNDGCNIDYTTFTFEELNIAWKAYRNALETLKELYVTDVEMVSFDEDTLATKDIQGNILPETDPKYIKNTYFWLDFACYKYTIIPNVENALKMYVLTDSNGELDRTQMDEDGNWIEYEGGNPWYLGDAKRVTESMTDAWLYDMSLYGTVELEAKRKAWISIAATIFKQGYIYGNDGSIPETTPTDMTGYYYNTPDETGWNRLTEEAQTQFTSQSSFIENLNRYLDYVSTWKRDNSLTHDKTKGVIALAAEARDKKQVEVDALIKKQEVIHEIRQQVADEVLIENFSEFTKADLELYYTLLRESDYTNENILITNLDDIVTTVDAQEELYQDAQKALYEKSRPQLSFEAKVSNIYTLENFENFGSNIDLYNFIRVSTGLYEDEFQKLRIVSIRYNPEIPTPDMELGFSNMTYSLDGINDLAFLFDAMTGSSTSSSSSSSSGGGTYGKNDAEIEISNNMLNALLKTKTFAFTVGDVVLNNISTNSDLKNIISSSGIFDDLRTGNMVISGKCINDTLQSQNYNGSGDIDNTVGSFMDWKTGRFNLGGGAITFDGADLYIRGTVTIRDWENVIADLSECPTRAQLKLGSVPINASALTGNVQNEAHTTVLDLDEGTFKVGDNFNIDAEGKMIASDCEITGKITTDNLTCTGGSIKITSKFEVSSDGILKASDVEIAGKVTTPNLNCTGGAITLSEPYNSTTSELNFNSTNNNTIIATSGINGRNMWFNDDVTSYKLRLATEDLDSQFPQGFTARKSNEWGNINKDGLNIGNGTNTSVNQYFTRNGVKNSAVYSTTTAGQQVVVSSEGILGVSSSSKRFKRDISKDTRSFHPKKLYDVPVVKFKYNDDYFSSPTDPSIDKEFIGFIAEDLADNIPQAVFYDAEGQPNGWDINVLFPITVKLLQFQNNELKELKKKVEELTTNG